MLLHRDEIAVVMQQSVSMFDAESADDEVGGLANGNAQFSQLAIISSSERGQVGSQQRYKQILTQSAFNTRGMGPVPSALENFEQDNVADQERLACRRFRQFGSRQV